MARGRVRRRPLPTVDRKIHFYRLNAGFNAGGQPRILDVTEYLELIENLPFTVDGRYLEFEADMFSCCWMDRNQANHRIRFSTIRRSGLPQVEAGGTLTPLRIPANSGLAEQIHVVFFPNAIVGSDFNFYGPRMNRLAFYLGQRAGLNDPAISFDPLLRQDVMAELNKLQDIRMLHMKIRAPYTAIVAQADRDLGSTFDAARRATNAEELEIILRMRPYSRESLAARIGRPIRTLLGRPDARTEMSQFKVKGLNRETRKVDLIDLLNDELISTKQIVRQGERTRALDADAAYGAIEQSYQELRRELEAAAAVGP
jgi:hypothetical protein